MILDQETDARIVDGKQARPKTRRGGREALLLDESQGLGFSKMDGVAYELRHGFGCGEIGSDVSVEESVGRRTHEMTGEPVGGDDFPLAGVEQIGDMQDGHAHRHAVDKVTIEGKALRE